MSGDADRAAAAAVGERVRGLDPLRPPAAAALPWTGRSIAGKAN